VQISVVATRLELWENECPGRLCTYALDNAVMQTATRLNVLHNFIFKNMFNVNELLGETACLLKLI
jgi:hypothetical protein